jgi:transposase
MKIFVLQKRKAMVNLFLFYHFPKERRKTMAGKYDSTILTVVHPLCCGLDVHKEKVSACIIYTDKAGNPQSEVQEFGTFTDDLYRLREWLLDHTCPIVGMESTGIYWRPVHNVLEDYLDVILVNARHVKNLPGRKTDIEDSKWLAGLLRHGLLRGSFIPPKDVRQWRELTRLRRKYIESLGDYKRRTHKLFESANIKIDSVVSDLFGVTGRNLMNILISQEREISLMDIEACAKGRLKKKAKELYRSIQGFFTQHHRYILSELLLTINTLEKQIEQINSRCQELMRDHVQILEGLKKIPGISDIAAQGVLSEIGPTLETFSMSAALNSWAGLCPGNNESAGKRHSGKSPVRKHPLKTLMIEIAWAAIRKKDSYYKEKYYRLKARRGSKKAIVAIAHRILSAIYYIIKEKREFKDLGKDFLLRKNTSLRVLKLKKEAYALGFDLVPITVSG